VLRNSRDARRDLVAFVEELLHRHYLAEARISPRIFDEAVGRPELREALWRRLILPRRERLLALLRRGMAVGQLRADLDLDLAPDLIRGASVAAARSAVLSGSGLSPDLAERIVAALWVGLAPERDLDR
jgi:hypothetical protein